MEKRKTNSKILSVLSFIQKAKTNHKNSLKTISEILQRIMLTCKQSVVKLFKVNWSSYSSPQSDPTLYRTNRVEKNIS